MNTLKFIYFTSLITLAGFSHASARPDYLESLQFKDVKFHIDQCATAGSEFSITGWYLSDSYPKSSELKIYLLEDGKRTEVPLKMINHNTESDGRFAGELSTPDQHSSFNANIEFVEKVNGTERVINYSCNSLQAF